MSTPTLTQFTYTVINNRGEVVEGKAKAPTEADLDRTLRAKGAQPLSIEATNSGLNKEINLFGKKRVKPKDLAVAVRQLSAMVNAGIPLVEAIGLLGDQTQHPTLRASIEEVRRSIESGSDFSTALEARPDIYPPLMAKMVRAGEASGDIDETLERIATSLESDVALRRQIKSAMTYPMVVGGMAVILVVVMLLFIVPVFEDMFSGLGGSLPLPTRVLVTLSEVMAVAVVPLIISAIIAVAVWRRNKNQPKVRAVVDPLKLRLPVFGRLTRNLVMARFSRNLSSMLSSGVPILEALDIVSNTTGSVVVSAAVDDVAASVSRGESLAAPLRMHPIFPPMVVAMVSIGEESGSVEKMLDSVADFYDAEVSAMTATLSSLLEPLVIAFLATTVGGMVIALYLPLFSIFELIQ